jgi:hypothetical protein
MVCKKRKKEPNLNQNTSISIERRGMDEPAQQNDLIVLPETTTNIYTTGP